MPMIWNEAADAKLFAGVLATNEGLKISYKELAAWMGNDCTAKAIEHRISKVKKMTKDTETTSAPKVAKSKPTGKRKGSTATEEADDNGGEGDDESPTKAKKPRAPPKKKATPKMAFGEAAQDDGVKDEDEGEVKIEDVGIVGGEA